MAELDYQLTFAGVPFFPDEAEAFRESASETPDFLGLEDVLRQYQECGKLSAEVDRLHPTRYTIDLTASPEFTSRNLGAVGFNWRNNLQPNEYVRPGDWYYPNTASRWSVFRGWVSSQMAKAMVTATNGGQIPGTLVVRQVPITPNPKLDGDYTVSTDMRLLPPRPLAEHGGGMDGLFLITLVDERYGWQFLPASLTVTATTTWADVIEALANVLGIIILYSDVDPAYLQPNPDAAAWSDLENAAVLLDAVAAAIGRVVVRNLDGSYSLLTHAESKARQDESRGNALAVTRLMGGDLFGDVGLPSGNLLPSRNAVAPATVIVSFPKFFLDPTPRPAGGKSGVYSSIIPITAGGEAVQGLVGVGSHSITATSYAVYQDEDEADPLNKDLLDALALRVAQDYYAGQALSALDETYPGCYAWQPDGLNDLLWRYTVRDRIASTRVFRSRWDQTSGLLLFSTPVPEGVVVPPVAPDLPPLALEDSLEFTIQTTLAADLMAEQLSAIFTDAEHFPTQNRWKGLIDDEVILFEGTNGLTNLTIVARGVDGTTPTGHPSGSVVTQENPDTAFNVVAVKVEKGQYLYTDNLSDDGSATARVVPQTQTVLCTSDSGAVIQERTHFPGRVLLYNYATADYEEQEPCWLIEPNDNGVIANKRYTAFFVGYSGGSSIRPVYQITEPTAGCADQTFYIYKTICEEGELNRYRAPVTLSFEDGCPTLEEPNDPSISGSGDDPWEFVTAEGCCECGGSGRGSGPPEEPGSGGGSVPGSGGGGDPPAGTVNDCESCLALPEVWALEVAGVTNNSCTSCADYNGTFLLTYQGESGGVLTWESEAGNPCEAPEIPIFRLTYRCSEDIWVLISGVTPPCAVYNTTGCPGGNLEVVFTSCGGSPFPPCACSNWPANLTLSRSA